MTCLHKVRAHTFRKKHVEYETQRKQFVTKLKALKRFLPAERGTGRAGQWAGDQCDCEIRPGVARRRARRYGR